MEQTPVSRSRQPDSKSGNSWRRACGSSCAVKMNGAILQDHLRIGRTRHALQQLRIDRDDLRVVCSVKKNLLGRDRFGRGHRPSPKRAEDRLFQIG